MSDGEQMKGSVATSVTIVKATGHGLSDERWISFRAFAARAGTVARDGAESPSRQRITVSLAGPLPY